MKIKNDFVTNSSSTCFVVLVPDNFVLSDRQFYDAVREESKWWEEEIDFDELKSEVRNYIAELQDGKQVYRSDYGDGASNEAYSIIDRIVHENGYGITSAEMSSNGYDIIIGIQQAKVIGIIAESTDLTKVVKIEE